MKNIKLTSIILVPALVFSIFLNSCSNADESNTINAVKSENNETNHFARSSKKSDYDIVGVIHNDGLDYFLNNSSLAEIKSFNVNGKIDTLGLAIYVKDIVNDYLREKGTFDIGTETIQLTTINDINDYFTIKNTSDSGSFVNCNNLILTNDSLCIDNVIANTDIKNQDYEKIMCTGKIYEYSLNYWSNFDNNTYLRGSNCGNFNWLSVGVSDAQGAWGGFGLGGPWGAVAFGLFGSAYNMAIQAAWNCA